MLICQREASAKLISTKTVMRDDVEAPVKAGTVVGTYQIYVADELVNEVNLVITEDIDQGWFPSYLGISNFATIIICIVFILLLTLFLTISITKARNRRRKRMMKKAAHYGNSHGRDEARTGTKGKRLAILICLISKRT